MPLSALRPSAAALVALAALASAAPGARAAIPAYASCPAPAGTEVVSAFGTECAPAVALARVAAAAGPSAAPAALRSAGWTPLRAAQATAGSFDLVAVRRRASVRLRLRGDAPDLDGWAAGRELVFARPTIVGGQPIPNGAALCTSSFLLRLSGTFGGLSAGHCAGLRSDGATQRRNAALRRPPQPGVVLGRVQRILWRSQPLDALVLPVPRTTTRTAGAVVERATSRPPSAVIGTSAPSGGLAVCFTGRTSGADRCGHIRGAGLLPAERALSVRARAEVRCTTIRAAEGDSGGPVYTAPRADGSVRAVGVVELIVGASARMCFTPIAPVLRGLGATVATSG